MDWDASEVAKWRSPANSVGISDGDGKIMAKQTKDSMALDLAKTFERVSLPVVCLDDALQLPKQDIARAVRVLRALEASSVRRMCGGTAPDHHGHLARVQVELIASTYCIGRCAE